MKTSFSDEMAMNWIADTLEEYKDDSEIVLVITAIVKLTGRDIFKNTQDEGSK